MVLCVVCGKTKEMKNIAWTNTHTFNTEGVCKGCLKSYSKIKLLDCAVGN